MDFFETIENRRSVRAFKDRPVEPEKLAKILETVNRAPSAGNLQAFEIYVMKEKLKREQLVQAALDQDFIAQAPLALVFCANSVRSQGRYGKRGESLYCGLAHFMKNGCRVSSARLKTIARWQSSH